MFLLLGNEVLVKTESPFLQPPPTAFTPEPVTQNRVVAELSRPQQGEQASPIGFISFGFIKKSSPTTAQIDIVVRRCRK
jgi:hypothetical protein